MAYATVQQFVDRFGYSVTANLLASLECGANNDPDLLKRILENHDCVTVHDGNIVQYPAGENLSGHLAVSLIDGKLFVTNPNVEQSALGCIGITDSAFAMGDMATAVVDGEVTFNGWNFVSGILFVGTGGVLTSTAPQTGYLIPFARVLGPTKIQIDIDSIVNMG